MIDKNLLFNSLSNAYEEAFIFLFVLFYLGVFLYIFYEELTDNYREEKKLLEFASTIIAIPMIATVGYLIMNGYLFLLVAGIVTLIMIFLYRFGIFDELLHRY